MIQLRHLFLLTIVNVTVYAAADNTPKSVEKTDHTIENTAAISTQPSNKRTLTYILLNAAYEFSCGFSAGSGWTGVLDKLPFVVNYLEDNSQTFARAGGVREEEFSAIISEFKQVYAPVLQSPRGRFGAFLSFNLLCLPGIYIKQRLLGYLFSIDPQKRSQSTYIDTAAQAGGFLVGTLLTRFLLIPKMNLSFISTESSQRHRASASGFSAVVDEPLLLEG